MYLHGSLQHTWRTHSKQLLGLCWVEHLGKKNLNMILKGE